jgi:hypothetical protein
MRLLELFRTSTPIQPLHQDGDHWMATWNDGDEQFIISFRPTDYPNTYTFYFAPNLAPDERPADFSWLTDFLKRKKSASGIFGQVVAYVRSFIAMAQPHGLVINPYEARRKRLYLSIVQALRPELASKGYIMVQPNDFTILLLKRRSRAYLQYRSEQARAMYQKVRDAKADMRAKVIGARS